MQRIIMDVPKWHVLQHREERALDLPDQKDSPRMQFEDEVFDRLYSGEPDFLPADKLNESMASWALAAHEQAEQMPRYTRLADEVRGDPMLAAAATDALVRELNPPDPEEPQEGQEPPPPPAPPAPHELRRKLTAGCLQAQAAVAEACEAREAFDGIGWGTGAGERKGMSDPKAAREVLRRLRDDKRLAKIAALAGRLKRIAANKRRSKVRHGADEVQDVEQGGEIARLIPAELAKLASKSFRLAVLRDVVERKAMQYRIDGSEQMGKGPIVVCLDKSGSMSGERDVWATAVALALLERAQRERRVFALVCFDSAVLFKAVVKPDQALPSEALFVQPSGGTSFEVAYLEAEAIIRDNPGTLRKADVILITDGQCYPDQGLIRQRMAAQGVSFLGFGIGTAPGALAPSWCDQEFSVTNLSTMDDKAAVALFAQAE